MRTTHSVTHSVTRSVTHCVTRTACRRAALACIAASALLLTGCAALRQSWLDWRLSLDPAASTAADPALQRQLEGHYARGAAALAAGDVDTAIAAWRAHVALAPARSPQARQLRGYLTLLQRESAARFARAAAARERAGERSGDRQPTDRLHVALFPFQDRGPDAARAAASAPFQRAVMALIVTDLARVPALTVLEREKVEHLLRELKLADSGLLDPATLPARGRLLGAGTVIAGSVYNEAGSAGPGSGRYRINTAVSDVAGARVIGTQEADGGQGEFHLLQKRIVFGILETLGITEIPASVQQVHTRSWAAYARFAAGLNLLAEDRFDEARQAFRAALQFDPGFTLAEEAFASTPEQGATLDGIRAAVAATRR